MVNDFANPLDLHMGNLKLLDMLQTTRPNEKLPITNKMKTVVKRVIDDINADDRIEWPGYLREQLH
jgi:hypothetical protein